MESHLQATLARISDIMARIGAMNAPASAPPGESPTQTPRPGSAGAAAPRPFDVMLAQAGGKVQLRPLGATEGVFAPDIEALITRYSAQNGLPPEVVRAVIQVESGGNPRAVSAVGARGLMQLMPETAQSYGVRDAFDPEQNIAAGTRHLAGLLREFSGDLSRALAAYNAGSAAVRKYGGVPPYAETQQYVQRILGMLGAR
ncbi:MAG TPA: lytic transglycosylase domain-containing protein [Chthonomonadaceae bacterium]|nr:lytic transglycosylase domain-containing protein [Chthonomonadaceae bacterium]